MVATRRRFNPNLQKVRIQEDGGGTRRVYVCARCLKSQQGHQGRLDSDIVHSGSRLGSLPVWPIPR